MTVAAPSTEHTIVDTLEIVVTLDDIALGERGDPYSCAIARAARRMGLRGASMGIDGHLVDGLSASASCWYSQAAGFWAMHFDDGKTVSPEKFVFTRMSGGK